jgi:hypothetical protein
LQVASSRLPVKEPASENTGQQPVTGNRKKAGFKEKREFELLEKEIADLENGETATRRTAKRSQCAL